MKRLLLTCAVSLAFVSSVTAQTRTLVENFRNVNCGNCREPDIEFEHWIEENHVNRPVDVIYYHNEITDVNDPFYKASQGDVDVRSKDLYKVSSNPRVFVQGVDAGTTVNEWKDFVQQAAGIPRQANLTFSELQSLGDNKYSFKINMTNASSQPAKLFVALTESGIVYNNTKLYLNPPSGKWDNIFRKMLPNAEGSNPSTGNIEMTLQFDLTGKNYNIANMQAIAFAQSPSPIQQGSNSFLIYGHAVQSLAPLADVAPDAPKGFSLKTMGNPFVNSTSLEVRLGGYHHLRMEMFDMTGKQVETLVNAPMTEGLYLFSPNAANLPAGTYLVNAYTDGNFAGQLKLIKQ